MMISSGNLLVLSGESGIQAPPKIFDAYEAVFAGKPAPTGIA
jgi:hypothetical protein